MNATVTKLGAILCLMGGASQGQVSASATSRAHSVAKHKWQGSGHRVAGAAVLRQQALHQKAGIPRPALSGGVSGAWLSIGPLSLPSDASGSGLQDYGFVSGRATAVAIDPNDPSGNTVFAGGAYGGVWKSTNAGNISPNGSSVNWTPLTDSQATLAIGAIAVQPQLSNPDPTRSVVLAGTGETDSSGDSYYGLGILRSADGGGTWSLISQDTTGTHSFAGLGFSQIAFNASNPNVAVAAAGSATEGIIEGLENPVTTNRGLYYSADAGVSWSAANVNDAGVATAPASVTSVAYNAAAGRFYAAIRFHGVYVSADGINWARLSAQPGMGLSAAVCPPQAVLPSSCPIYRGEVAVVPNRGGKSGLGEMYVWYVDANGNDQGIWQSLDGGASWLPINDSGITNCGDLFGGCGTSQGSFDLTLAAVPNGTATDLYAGAVNIYKCTLTTPIPSCTGPAPFSFMNLTHVYGCSDIARVHPDQHAMDFLVSNGTSLMYFANDGGVYRTLDGFGNLQSGSCGVANGFDDLNAALGPMTQFVSLSQSSSDPNVIFGGTQDNGAPATAFSQSSGAWVSVNGGDDGFTALNPSNESEWFVATPPDSISGANIFRCANGINCHSLDFQSDQVVDSAALGGDSAGFYMPFILDPQNSSTIVAGTCRIWRGSSQGGAFQLLSPNFENGGAGSCTGSEVNMVRAIAAGGVTDPNGNSQVIYAGTNGEGPLIPTTPRGGHLWVTTNAGAGPVSWVDVTQNINPQAFPISGIALDAGDPLGKTAYITVMGFHTPHVWKTSNAGASWTDFSSNLPDAPVNAIVVDQGSSLANGTVYVGTDVGVFASSTGSPNWTAVDPSAAGQGFLPNVAVTSLKIFNASGLKRLRAATYGRGIWEWNLVTTPDFQLSFSNNPATTFADQSAVFSGTIFELNGYNTGVNLSCTAAATAPPQTCVINPSLLLPTPSGTPFTVTAGGNAGNYSFNVHGVGLDPLSTNHDFALTLHIVDFSLSTPSPSSVSVSPGNTGAPVSLSVSASGAFSSTVSLSCSGLPSGVACQFQPSSVSPTAGNPVSVSLTVSAAANTPPGTSQVAINASTSGDAPKIQILNLTVGNAPDYVPTIANSPLTGTAGVPAQFNGRLTAINGYNNSVNLSCGAAATAPPPTCQVAPASATPGASGTPFTVTVSSNVAQAYSFNINAVGTDTAFTSHSVTVNFSALANQTFDFTMNASPASSSIAAGQTATFNIDVNPNTGAFPANVTFSCSKLPALTSCTFAPAQVGSGSGDSLVTLSIATTAPVPRMSAMKLSLLSLPLCAILLFKRTRRRIQCGLVLGTLGLLVSCGGGLQGGGGGGGSGSPGTPPGTYAITVTATSGSVTHTGPTPPLSLTVTP